MIIVTTSSTTHLQQLLVRLHSEFAMVDLGDLHFFLGSAVNSSSVTMFLSPRQYAADLLQRASMAECHSLLTLVDISAKLFATDGDLPSDTREYRSCWCGTIPYSDASRHLLYHLAYLYPHACSLYTSPCPSKVCSLVHSGHHGLWPASSRIVLDLPNGLLWRALCWLSRFSSIYLRILCLLWRQSHLLVFQAPDYLVSLQCRGWVSCCGPCGCWVFLGLIVTSGTSSTSQLDHCCLLRQGLRIYMSTNRVQHRHTKHIKIDIHFVWEKVSVGEVRVLHVSSAL
jgi:hypothetical protein